MLLRTLGEGTQGETYEAIDNGAAPNDTKRAGNLADEWSRYVRRASSPNEDLPRSAQLVAIKCFRIGKAKAWKDVELAEREARTLASLSHPRLPKYIEHYEEDGALYLVMEKIEGESLAALRATLRTWSADEVVRMLEDIGDALRYLHGRIPPIVHRDIKPANVIRRPDGSFALVDFGAVRDRLKPAGGSTVVGTFGYMAPEQFQGRAAPRSDVYGLAATALAMLTGEEPENLPHEGLGIDVRRAASPRTPESLVRALEAMLVADPDRRTGSIDDALTILRSQRSLHDRTRHPKQEYRRARRLTAREAKKQRRSLARARRAPFVPRLVAKFGLLVATLAVWIAVGIFTPLLLVLLSLAFGASLRRAASACRRAARRSQLAMGRASSWLSGHRETEDAIEDRVRIAVTEGASAEGDERERFVGLDDEVLDAEPPGSESFSLREERLRASAPKAPKS